MKSATKAKPSIATVHAAVHRIERLLKPVETKVSISTSGSVLPLRPRMIKIGAKGEQLAAGATGHVAVLLPDYGLMFDVAAPAKARNWAHAKELGAACNVLGLNDWQLASDEELQLLIRRDRFNPPIDTDFFPNTPTNDWFWTRTEYASSSDYAWLVSFDNGYVNYNNRSYSGFVRACRRVPSRQ